MNPPITSYMNNQTLQVNYNYPVTGIEWIDCGNNQAISGENSILFTPSAPGRYATRVHFNSCPSLTSECITFPVEAIPGYTISPNPVSGQTAVLSYEGTSPQRAVLLSYMGIILLDFYVQPGDNILDFSGIQTGTYFFLMLDGSSYQTIIRL